MAGVSAMSALASTTLISGCSLKWSDHSSLKCHSMNIFVKTSSSKKAVFASKRRTSTCQAIISGDSERPSSTSLFVGGFLLGGFVVGTLGCVYAPQIIRTLNEADSEDIMRKLPKFLYDDDTILDRTRKKLTERIEKLNAAIDGVSSRLRPGDVPRGISIESDDFEAAV